MIPLVSQSVCGYENPDAEVLHDYAKRLLHFSKLAKTSNLEAGFELKIVSSPLRRNPRGRPLHSALRNGGVMVLNLARSLLPPRKTSNMSSAVWLATILALNGAVIPGLPPSVVVKFIQPSQLESPYSFKNPQLDDWENFLSPDWLARNEAAGYDRLNDLQGTIIPYFFGKYIVRVSKLQCYS